MRMDFIDHGRPISGQRYSFSCWNPDDTEHENIGDPTHPVRLWCLENLGPPDRHEPTARYWFSRTDLWIRDEVDAAAFRIVWC
jgi:hypothetical protein